MPASMLPQALLRRMAQGAFVPLAVSIQHAEFTHQRAYVLGVRTRHRQIVRAPRELPDDVLPAAGITTGDISEFEQQPVAHAVRIKSPPGAQSANAAADDRHSHLSLLARRRECEAITNGVAR